MPVGETRGFGGKAPMGLERDAGVFRDFQFERDTEFEALFRCVAMAGRATRTSSNVHTDDLQGSLGANITCLSSANGHRDIEVEHGRVTEFFVASEVRGVFISQTQIDQTSRLKYFNRRVVVRQSWICRGFVGLFLKCLKTLNNFGQRLLLELLVVRA